LATRPVEKVEPMPAWKRGQNDSYLVEFEDGGKAIYKPVAGEHEGLRRQVSTSGYQGEREVGMYRLDEELGFGRVPTTTWWDGPHGPGSLQEWHDESVGYLTLDAYDLGQREEMAVLDHVGGSEDRGESNIRSDRRGEGETSSLLAIDNGQAFPDRPVDPKARSRFVTLHPTRGLSPGMVERLRAVDVDRLRRRLLDAGLPDQAVDDALDRLAHLRDTGRLPDNPPKGSWW
jgi:hypothetical protein